MSELCKHTSTEQRWVTVTVRVADSNSCLRWSGLANEQWMCRTCHQCLLDGLIDIFARANRPGKTQEATP